MAILLVLTNSLQAAEDQENPLVLKGVQLTEKKGDVKIWDLSADSVEYKEGNAAFFQKPEILFYDKSGIGLKVEASTALYNPDTRIFTLSQDVRLYSPSYKLMVFSQRVLFNYPTNTIESDKATKAVTEEKITLTSSGLKSDLSLQRVDFKGPVRVEIPVEEK